MINPVKFSCHHRAHQSSIGNPSRRHSTRPSSQGVRSLLFLLPSTKTTKGINQYTSHLANIPLSSEFFSLKLIQETNPCKNESHSINIFNVIISNDGGGDSNHQLCGSQNTFKYIILFTKKNGEGIKGNIIGNYLKYQRSNPPRQLQGFWLKQSLTGIEKQAFLILPKSQEVISIKKAKG